MAPVRSAGGACEAGRTLCPPAFSQAAVALPHRQEALNAPGDNTTCERKGAKVLSYAQQVDLGALTR